MGRQRGGEVSGISRIQNVEKLKIFCLGVMDSQENCGGEGHLGWQSLRTSLERELGPIMEGLRALLVFVSSRSQ